MRKNISGQVVTAQLISLSDGSNVTTGTVTVFVTGDGGTQTSGGGTVTHEGNGTWSYLPTQVETNFNHVVFTFTHASAITAAIQLYTISFDPHDVTNLGLSNLDATVSSRSTFNPATDTVANVTLVATTTDVTNGVTVATNNDKTGYSISGTKTTLDALNDIAATDIVSAGAITTLSGAVVNVDTVDTCTTNTDMRGTDNALLASSAPTNFGDLAITSSTGQVTVGTNNDKSGYSIAGTITTLDGLNNFDPVNDAVANVTTVGTVTGGVTVSTNNDKSGYTLTQAFPTNFDSMNIDASGRVDSLVQGFLNTTITETSAGRIANNFDFFYDNSNVQTTKTVDDVGTGSGGGGSGDWTTAERSQIRYRLGIDGTVIAPSTNNPDLAQKSDISSLNDFDPANDIVARVTLVDTTTANTDMRGTDSALLASNYTAAPTVAQVADAVWDEAQAGHTTVGTFGYYLDSQVSSAGGGSLTAADIWTYSSRSLTDKVGFSIAGTKTTLDSLNDISAANVWSNATRTLSSGTNIVLAKGTGITGFNDLSFNDIWTGQLTESYAADGVAPTPAQALMLGNQFHQDFSIAGTSYTVKGLNGTTTVATFTLDDATNPTSITRSS